MADTSQSSDQRRLVSRSTVIIAAVAAAAAFIGGRATAPDTPNVRTISGEVQSMDVYGELLLFVGRDGDGYHIGNGLTWTGADGLRRYGGQPECLPPDSYGAWVELGYLEDVPDVGRQVVWVHCQSLPTGFRTGYPEESPEAQLYDVESHYRRALEREGQERPPAD